MLELFVCPKCQKQLSVNNEKIICGSCAKAWKVIDGVPQFTTNDFYWGEIPKEEALRLISTSKEIGWRAGLEQVLKEKYPNLYDYITNDLRCEFRYILPITNDSVVLDVGAGWGTISIGLSRLTKAVVAVELIKERVEFIKTRMIQDNIKNLTVIKANMMELPIPSNFFDCIIINGALEWVGLFDTSKDPRTLQSQFLQKMYQILKPSGYIYIGIENRIGYGMFYGALDHSGLKYTSIMPRWLANLYCKIISRRSYRTDKRFKSYRTYTYSRWGYRRLLEDNQFSNIKFFMPLPSYNLPIEFVDLENKEVIYYYIKHFIEDRLTFKGKAKKKLLLTATRIGMIPLFTEDFSIIAQKVVYR